MIIVVKDRDFGIIHSFMKWIFGTFLLPGMSWMIIIHEVNPVLNQQIYSFEMTEFFFDATAAWWLAVGLCHCLACFLMYPLVI